ncbi:hypothetical protein EHI8A_095120 [Entamoeba histolytica HM-1:IMSS-B]|uniref:Uncharacterized protein n=5 Tax=Entamoeba histolytica TaxID=5759 RepID=C4M3C9_ENTH1|nr:hypothetical protein EHI_053110 [Entamoeba histolytica HM-1:IMSS]EAL51745.1 hypothetical protein EHI_053110 [Entamoeba histolytica HM-1:IMSS]EMH73168.1 hypothetical protein EHI8A_095120 [Entamoeba histolytica HM-1:IMSS-B]ENY62306.1 hypothetical protein EHI7A_093190 [Entamoeba histolytica HM-1:IMSS-A]GAT95814.1 hypothetical protein CL6EHI_053110 [Entamoeba histolytica]|eukprot:XP_657129.1 hypothetical protein EHI_053110 [Entamoeba histolytica HM-1:IMSS]
MSRFFVPSDSPSPNQTLTTEYLYPRSNYTQLPQQINQLPILPKPRRIVKKRENGEFLKSSSYVESSHCVSPSTKPKPKNEWLQPVISKTPPEKVLIHQNRHAISSSTSPDEIQKQNDIGLKSQTPFTQSNDVHSALPFPKQTKPNSTSSSSTIVLAAPPPKFFALQNRGILKNEQNLIAPGVSVNNQKLQKPQITPSLVLSGETKQQIAMFSEKKRLQRVGSTLNLDRKRKYITWKAKEGNSIIQMPQLVFKQPIQKKEEIKQEETYPNDLEPLKDTKINDFSLKVSSQSIAVLIMETHC